MLCCVPASLFVNEIVPPAAGSENELLSNWSPDAVIETLPEGGGAPPGGGVPGIGPGTPPPPPPPPPGAAFTTTDPLIVGWTSQWKKYVPSGRPGTSYFAVATPVTRS